MDLDVDDY
ncbi:MAG: hypothetical protein EZS28_052987, partial [Streblomastix strix]